MRTVFALLGFVTLASSAGPASDRKPGLPALYVIGDSTANLPNRQGWADPLADYFDVDKISVLNRAMGGRSARSFFTEGSWNRTLADLKPGDYVLIQFGHNDGGIPDQPPARADLPGTGDEARQLTMPDGKTELVHTFGWYIRRFVRDAEAKGAHPVVLSVTVRYAWQNGKVERGLNGGRYGMWSEEVARAENVPFVDLTNIAANAFEKMGRRQVWPLFEPDCTHTTRAGADFNASLVVAGLKGIRSPLTEFLSAKGQAVPPASILP